MKSGGHNGHKGGAGKVTSPAVQITTRLLGVTFACREGETEDANKVCKDNILAVKGKFNTAASGGSLSSLTCSDYKGDVGDQIHLWQCNFAVPKVLTNTPEQLAKSLRLKTVPFGPRKKAIQVASAQYFAGAGKSFSRDNVLGVLRPHADIALAACFHLERKEVDSKTGEEIGQTWIPHCVALKPQTFK